MPSNASFQRLAVAQQRLHIMAYHAFQPWRITKEIALALQYFQHRPLQCPFQARMFCSWHAASQRADVKKMPCHPIPYYLHVYIYIYTPYYTMQNRNITYHTIQNRNATLHMNSMNITLHRIEVPPVTVVFSTVSYISYPTLPHHTVAWSYINYIAYTTCPFFPRPPLIAFRTCRNPCCLGTTQKAFTSFSITI